MVTAGRTVRVTIIVLSQWYCGVVTVRERI